MAKPLLYWDTSIFLCFLNREEMERSAICEDVLQHAAMDELTIVTSTYTIVEVIRPKRRLGQPLTPHQVDKIKGMFRWPFIQTIEVDERTAFYASDLAREYNLRPADSLHAASAILWKAEALYAWDQDFSRISHLIPVEQPRFISQQRELEGFRRARLSPRADEFEE